DALGDRAALRGQREPGQERRGAVELEAAQRVDAEPAELHGARFRPQAGAVAGRARAQAAEARERLVVAAARELAEHAVPGALHPLAAAGALEDEGDLAGHAMQDPGPRRLGQLAPGRVE